MPHNFKVVRLVCAESLALGLSRGRTAQVQKLELTHLMVFRKEKGKAEGTGIP